MQNSEMKYGVRSKDYVSRAKALLNESTHESLIYTALELRAGIEARLKEFFDAQAETTEKKRKGWKISKLAAQVENVINAGEKCVKLTTIDELTNTIIAEVWYTPVLPELRKMAEKLGNYLHSIEKKIQKMKYGGKNLSNFLKQCWTN